VRGIHKGELDGLPPTGNEISVSLFTIFRLVDGKIAEEWEIMDELGMMTQLGFGTSNERLRKNTSHNMRYI